MRPHAVRAYYYGLTGDGHIGRLNMTHAFYQVLGHDTFNEIAGRTVDINAQMAAVELSLDKDWLRYRVSFFYASGDKNPRDGTARGFDTIFDNPNFARRLFQLLESRGHPADGHRRGARQRRQPDTGSAHQQDWKARRIS